MTETFTHIELTADIVSAYVTNNMVSVSELSTLIAEVHRTLVTVAAGNPQVVAAALVPAVPIKKSVQPDYIVCLEDGQQFKSLKRHLRTKYNMSPEDYRARWGLPSSYPMVAPDYAVARSNLAKASGLGQRRRKGQAVVPDSPAPVATAKRGRPNKAA